MKSRRRVQQGHWIFAVAGNVKMFPRSILVAIVIGCAMLASASAQELRDRELKPAFDFTTIETPVQIVSIKLNGSEVAPGQKIKGDDNWLTGVSFTVRN